MSNQTAIKHLNIILKNELTAINQYFLHAKLFKHLGYTKLAAAEYEESIDEMKHADALCDRIFFLGGLPNLQDLGKIFIGQDVKEALECDMELEKIAYKDLQAAHAACDLGKDTVTVMLIEDIMKSEEEHRDWIRKQLSLIDSMGIQNYLQQQI